MQLRPYQSLALDEIRAYYAKGVKKVLLHLATGGGKTLIFCRVLDGVKCREKRAMMVVHGKKLVDQASQRLDREGVDHGVIMSGHWRMRPNLPIQVASIDTLYARRNKQDLPPFDLIVIDEAHMATSPSFLWLFKQYEKAFFLPVTATPHVKKGLKHIAEVVVYPITIKELISQGFLVAPEYYAPSKPSLENVKIDRKTGDYNLDELSEAMQKANLYGDMITSYRKFANELPTLLFCVDVKHSREVCAVFNAAGIEAEHVDASMPEKERSEVVSRLETGKTKVITNVGIFTVGVDIPCVQCIILARPTKSYNLYVQILGRGTRPYPKKKKFYVLDHADCISEHGFIEREKRCNLNGEKEVSQKPFIVTCKCCYHVWDPYEQWSQKHQEEAEAGMIGRDYICEGVLNDTVCGFDNTPKNNQSEGGERKTVVDENYELKKIDSLEEFESSNVKLAIRQLVPIAVSRGYSHKWVYFKIKNDPKFGSKVASKHYKFIEKEMESFVV